MISVLGTGLSGLVGTRVVDLLASQYKFQDISRETGYDICNYPQMDEIISKTSSQWIFHLAAYTDVAGAEKEKDLGIESQSWKINVDATEHISTLCKKYGKKLLYISTDYVFDGTKNIYTEEDTPNPISWYGKTKYEGEKRIISGCPEYLIIRIANPYRGNSKGKKDFVHKIIDRFMESQPVMAPFDQIFSPTYIDDIAVALDGLVKADKTGIYHVVGKTALSPYEAARSIARVFGFDEANVTKTTYEEYFRSKAKAPKQAALKHDKIDNLGIPLHTFEEGLEGVKKQESELS